MQVLELHMVLILLKDFKHFNILHVISNSGELVSFRYVNNILTSSLSSSNLSAKNKNIFLQKHKIIITPRHLILMQWLRLVLFAKSYFPNCFIVPLMVFTLISNEEVCIGVGCNVSVPYKAVALCSHLTSYSLRTIFWG